MATEPLKEVLDAERAAPSKGQDCSQRELVKGLLRRDEEACRLVFRKYDTSLVRVARGFVRSRALAEELVQETWFAFFDGLERFEGRSNLKTWLFAILIRKAKKLGKRESRMDAFSQLGTDSEGLEMDALDGLIREGNGIEGGEWISSVAEWKIDPEGQLIQKEILEVVGSAIDRLPSAQRLVVLLRDADGWSAGEIADLVGRTPNWVRVNLHRGRVRIRAEVEEYLAETGVESR